MKEKEAMYRFWISQNYKKLLRKEKSKISFCEDAFHDAIIDLWNAIVSLEKVTLSAFDNLFLKLYKANISKAASHSIKFLNFDNEIMSFILSQQVVEDEETDENEDSQTGYYANEIKRYLRTFPIDDQRVFLLYVEKSMSLKSLSQYTGIQEAILHNKITTIKETIVKYIYKS